MADQHFDDIVNVAGMDDDAEPNSRVVDYRLRHADLAREVKARNDIEGIGFEIAQRSKPK